jgi:hypothetical protein
MIGRAGNVEPENLTGSFASVNGQGAVVCHRSARDTDAPLLFGFIAGKRSVTFRFREADSTECHGEHGRIIQHGQQEIRGEPVSRQQQGFCEWRKELGNGVADRQGSDRACRRAPFVS